MSNSATPASDVTPPQYAWAEHLIWMEGGEPVTSSAPVRQLPGVVLAFCLTLIAMGIPMVLNAVGWTKASLVDPVLVGILLGLVVGNTAAAARWLPGMSVTVRKVLPIGIILLGARMDFFEAMRVGLPGLGLSAAVVVCSLILLLVLGRIFKIENRLALLLGVGTGICGGTAIVAIAPILSARDRDIMLGVGLVTLLGLIGMLVLPVIAGWLGLSQTQFGLVAGLTIHQTPQVIASGFAYGDEAGQVATVAKLARVCLLAPMAVILGWWVSRQPSLDGGMGGPGKAKPWYRLLPGFALGFLILAVVRSMGLLPSMHFEWSGLVGAGDVGVDFDLAKVLKKISGILLAMGMVAVGYQTRLSQAKDIGWRPIVAASAASGILAVLVILIVKLFFS